MEWSFIIILGTTINQAILIFQHLLRCTKGNRQRAIAENEEKRKTDAIQLVGNPSTRKLAFRITHFWICHFSFGGSA
jgi:hypothetical protein